MTEHEAKVLASEYIAERFAVILASTTVPMPEEALRRIQELESALARAESRLVEDGQARIAAEMKIATLASAVEQCSTRFAELINAARAEIPPATQTHVADIEKRLAATTEENGKLRKERDEAVRIANRLDGLRAAAYRWHQDSFSPRLRNAIDAFMRAEVAHR